MVKTDLRLEVCCAFAIPKSKSSHPSHKVFVRKTGNFQSHGSWDVSELLIEENTSESAAQIGSTGELATPRFN